MTSRRIDDELLALYALDVLGAQDAARVEAAVAESPALAAKLAEHRAAVASLGAAAAVPPPADLKQRVLDAAFSELAPKEKVEEEPPGVVVPFERKRRIRWQSFAPAVGLAAAMLVAVLLVQRGGDTHKTAVLSGPGATKITVDIVGDEMSLAAANLPVLDAEHEYQLWLVDADAEVRSAGVFAPHEDGTFDGRMKVSVDDAEALAVTVEPSGGSESATTPIMYQGELG